MTTGVDPNRVLCALAELSNPQTRELTLGRGEWPLRAFVVRQGAGVYAYVNRCPHAGHPLNWQANAFLAPGDGSAPRLLRCASHGALFEVASGYCVAGPCAGAALTPITIEVRDGYVLLTEDPQALAQRYA